MPHAKWSAQGRHVWYVCCCVGFTLWLRPANKTSLLSAFRSSPLKISTTLWVLVILLTCKHVVGVGLQGSVLVLLLSLLSLSSTHYTWHSLIWHPLDIDMEFIVTFYFHRECWAKFQNLKFDLQIQIQLSGTRCLISSSHSAACIQWCTQQPQRRVLQQLRQTDTVISHYLVYTVNHKKTWHFIFDYNFGQS